MNTDTQTMETSPKAAVSSSPPGPLVLVRCASYTCLAFRDADDRWISYFGRKEVTDVLEVLTSVRQWNQS